MSFFEETRPNFSNMFNAKYTFPTLLISDAQTWVPTWEGCDYKMIDCIMGIENLDKIGYFD